MFFPFFPLEERGLPSRYEEVEIRKFTQVSFPQVTESGKYSSSCPNIVHPPQVKFNLVVEFFFFFWLKPAPPAMKSWSLNHWTAGEVLGFAFFTITLNTDLIPNFTKTS